MGLCRGGRLPGSCFGVPGRAAGSSAGARGAGSDAGAGSCKSPRARAAAPRSHLHLLRPWGATTRQKRS